GRGPQGRHQRGLPEETVPAESRRPTILAGVLGGRVVDVVANLVSGVVDVMTRSARVAELVVRQDQGGLRLLARVRRGRHHHRRRVRRQKPSRREHPRARRDRQHADIAGRAPEPCAQAVVVVARRRRCRRRVRGRGPHVVAFRQRRRSAVAPEGVRVGLGRSRVFGSGGGRCGRRPQGGVVGVERGDAVVGDDSASLGRGRGRGRRGRRRRNHGRRRRHPRHPPGRGGHLSRPHVASAII
ncbi:unnamed protein product, partial [Ectocarpus fasciculatus]